MKCQRCKKAESTGTIIALCDACFDLFEKEVKRDDTGKGQCVPTDAELEYFNEPFIKRPN